MWDTPTTPPISGPVPNKPPVIHASPPPGDPVLEMDKNNFFGVIFYLLLDSMTVRQETVKIQATDIKSNAKVQDKLNEMNGEIKFSILPSNAQQATINRIQEQNEEYAAVRANITNRIMTTRQNAQQEMTKASTNVSVLQQYASEASGSLSIYKDVVQLIQEMSGG
jgi:hypothetical protein